VTTSASPRLLLVVRRGDLDRLHRLKERFGDLPLDIVVDRRQHDRRWRRTTWPTERRRHERRDRWTGRFPSSAFIFVPAALAGEWVAQPQGMHWCTG